MLVSLFTAIYMLGGPVPTVKVVPMEYSDSATCQASVEATKGAPLPLTEFNGLPVLSVFYDCEIMDTSAMAKIVTQFPPPN